MLHAQIQMVVSRVHVIRALLEMELPVMISVSALPASMSAMHTQPAQSLPVATAVHVAKVSMVMAAHVTT